MKPKAPVMQVKGEVRFEAEPKQPTLVQALMDLGESLVEHKQTLVVERDEVLTYKYNGDWVWQFKA